VKEIQKKYEDYERTFWHVVMQVESAEGAE
jgi:hypothetical protein